MHDSCVNEIIMYYKLKLSNLNFCIPFCFLSMLSIFSQIRQGIIMIKHVYRHIRLKFRCINLRDQCKCLSFILTFAYSQHYDHFCNQKTHKKLMPIVGSLLCRVSYAIWLVPIRFWRVMAQWLRCSIQWWATGLPQNVRPIIKSMKKFAHNWYLPWSQCTEASSRGSFIQK